MLERATEKDYTAVCGIYRAACEGMEHEGLDLWHWGEYPSAAIVEEDIREGWCYVCKEEGRILGVVCVNRLGDDAYAQVPWQLQGEVGLFHRIAVSPEARGKGLALKMLQSAADILRAQGCTVMRGDVAGVNLKAKRLYERFGFSFPGIFHADWCEEPDFAWGMEKAL